MRKLLLLMLLVPIPAWAQFVRGKATDASTGARISGVHIRIMSMSGRPLYGVVTTDSGTFNLPIPVGSTVRVRAERIGYAPATSEPYAVNRGDLLEIDVQLAAQPIELQQITVVGTKPMDPRLTDFYERSTLNKRMGQGKIWTRSDLEKHPPARISNLLYGVHNRGLADPSCGGSEVFIDDLPIGVTPDEEIQPIDIDLAVAPEDVEGVEIYRGSEIPIQYDRERGPDAKRLCQVVLIWRKSYSEGATFLTWRRAIIAFTFVGGIVLSSIFFWKL